MARPLILESARAVDADYQRDRQSYVHDLQRLLRRLEVRATPEVKNVIASIDLRLVNRGRAEAFTINNSLVVDIALLDLLGLFSFEQAMAQIKNDSLHLLEFHVAYSVALSTNKQIEQLDPHNFSSLSESQWRQLWNDTLKIQAVIYDNTLAFILTHELGHIVTRHQASIQQDFPEEASRVPGNEAWTRRRRAMELEADEFAAKLSLDALFQPAQMLPWFMMTSTRRNYYGVSPEYPTPGQREAAIKKVYAERLAVGAPQGFELPELAPLAPDRDMARVDKVGGLKNIREVRNFAGAFFAATDEQLAQYLDSGTTVDEAVDVIVSSVLLRKALIQGTQQPELLDRILSLFEPARNGDATALKEIRAGIGTAMVSVQLQEILLELLEESPPDWATLAELLRFARQARPELALGLDISYYLANTRFRWQPEVFKTMLAALPGELRESINLRPYRLGTPSRKPPLSTEEMIELLKRWDGSYHPR